MRTVIRQPTVRHLSANEIELVFACPGDSYANLTTLYWAAGSYILAFTSTLLLLKVDIQNDFAGERHRLKRRRRPS